MLFSVAGLPAITGPPSPKHTFVSLFAEARSKWASLSSLLRTGAANSCSERERRLSIVATLIDGGGAGVDGRSHRQDPPPRPAGRACSPREILWPRFLSDPTFLRRYREFYWTRSLLGLLYNRYVDFSDTDYCLQDDIIPIGGFVPTTKASPLKPSALPAAAGWPSIAATAVS
jgi:hypothetical protein